MRSRSLLGLSLLLLAASLFADGGANHQTRNLHFGVSGSNVNDSSRAFCCGGTLGSLVTDGVSQYILSNNHVLARTDQAVAGEDVIQPGLIDNGCRVATIVADFTVAPPLNSNVDAAIAQVVPGTMDSTGFIEDIGTISGTVSAPGVGMVVAKSGRTTGFTTGTISSINANVNVQYQRGCGMGRKFVVLFTNQVVVSSSTFSAGGDSGSLIVTNDTAHQPVALLYAGSSTTTIGNPAGEVLEKLGAALGSPVSFVGGGKKGGGGGGPRNRGPLELPAEAVEQAGAALRQHRGNLMAIPNVIGTGIGASPLNPFEPVIVIYVDHTAGPVPDLPDVVDGIRVQRVLTDPFVAY